MPGMTKNPIWAPAGRAAGGARPGAAGAGAARRGRFQRLCRIERGSGRPNPKPGAACWKLSGARPRTSKQAGWLIAGVAKDAEGPAVPGRAALSLGFAVEDRARARLVRRAAQPPPEFQDCAALKTFGDRGPESRHRRPPELQTPEFWEILCGESEKVARADTQQATALAELALDMAEWIPLPEEAQRPAYRGAALAYYGNALRVQGQLPRAEQAFQESDVQWKAGFRSGPASTAHASSTFGRRCSSTFAMFRKPRLAR